VIGGLGWGLCLAGLAVLTLYLCLIRAAEAHPDNCDDSAHRSA
jgi:hypothetical protein